MKVYSIWSEDQGSWWPTFATLDKQKAEDMIMLHIQQSDIGVGWLEQGLIYIEECELT